MTSLPHAAKGGGRDEERGTVVRRRAVYVEGTRQREATRGTWVRSANGGEDAGVVSAAGISAQQSTAAAMLEETRLRLAKQQRTAKRIFERLRIGRVWSSGSAGPRLQREDFVFNPLHHLVC